MTKNVGGIDRILRIVVGVALLAYAIAGPDTGYNMWGYIGIIPLATGLISWCPLYPILGIRTCKANSEEV